MAIANYSDLANSIASWMHRSDLTSVIPDFIRLAESRIQNDADLRQLDTTGIITTTAAVNTIRLPGDFNQMRSVSLVVGASLTQILDPMTPDMLLQRYSGYTSSIPRAYAIRGDYLLLGPAPDSSYPIYIEYEKVIPGIDVNTYSTYSTSSTLSMPGDFVSDIKVSLTSGGVKRVLNKYDSLVDLFSKYASAANGVPVDYALAGSNISLGPAPDNTYSTEIIYKSSITGISRSSTNDVLNAYPELYLHACLCFAAQYTRDAELAQGMEALYQQDLDRINNQNWAQMTPLAAKVY